AWRSPRMSPGSVRSGCGAVHASVMTATVAVAGSLGRSDNRHDGAMATGTGRPPDAALTELVDVAALTRWLDAQGFPAGPVEGLAPLAGGTQNLLVRFCRGG